MKLNVLHLPACNVLKKTVLLFSISATLLSARADVKMPQIFSDGMVLQRNQNIPVWGWASPKEEVTVIFNEQKRTAIADKNGHWKILLDPLKEGGPYKMTITGKNLITIKDILMGEVWICSGQSNMEFQVATVNDAANEIKNSNYPLIRQIKVPVKTSIQPLEDIQKAQWFSCNPSTVQGFTAVGYFFGLSLYQILHVPIGLINASCGGTIIETWMSKPAFENSDLFKTMIASLPQNTVESINEKSLQKMVQRINESQGGLPDKAAIAQWMKPNMDDNHWPIMQMPAIWETKGWPQLDGKVWFRKEIVINDPGDFRDAWLQLGTVDDNDEAFINGVKVGATRNNLAEKRKYKIPGGLLKKGINVIAVLIEDNIGGGGFTGLPADLKLSSATESISLAGDWKYKIESVSPSGFSVFPNDYPTLLYNGMISPLRDYASKGVIWYQGESNADRAFEYRSLFPPLISDWRQQWHQPELPFLFVQLASWDAHSGNMNGSEWAELREAQALALNIPHTGMAVTIDIGNALDIHPRNKQDVGKRLAAIALNQVYGQSNAFEGPVFQSMKVENNTIMLSFKNVPNGFRVTSPYGYIHSFKIAGTDRQFYYAKARIEGNHIVVYHDSITQPVAVRYAWDDSPDDVDLYNKDGFPVVPFRTDNWPLLTEKDKYRIPDAR